MWVWGILVYRVNARPGSKIQKKEKEKEKETMIEFCRVWVICLPSCIQASITLVCLGAKMCTMNKTKVCWIPHLCRKTAAGTISGFGLFQGSAMPSFSLSHIPSEAPGRMSSSFILCLCEFHEDEGILSSAVIASHVNCFHM